jgi:hypothetical protein
MHFRQLYIQTEARSSAISETGCGSQAENVCVAAFISETIDGREESWFRTTGKSPCSSKSVRGASNA